MNVNGYFCFNNTGNNVSKLMQATFACGINRTAEHCIDEILNLNFIGSLNDFVAVFRSYYNQVQKLNRLFHFVFHVQHCKLYTTIT